MQTAFEAVTTDQRTKVAAAVSAAESKSCCEIVPVVATASGRYDRAEDIVGLWCAMLGAIAVFLAFPGDVDSGHWGGFPVWAQVLLMVAVMAVCFLVGAVLADRFHGLRLLFTARQQMKEEVNLRARELFFDRRVHHTEGASGVLIFVSLYERMAVVLGDRTVVEKLGEEFPQQLCERLTEALRKDDVGTAICDTIHHAATSLATALPRGEDDVNELSDALVLLD